MSAPTHQDVVRWCDGAPHNGLNPYAYETHIANAAYAAGFAAAEAQRPAAPDAQAAADAELEACCEFLDAEVPKYGGFMRLVPALRAARRPPAPSVREQAIKALRERLNGSHCVNAPNFDAMRLALRALEGGDGQ